MAICKSDKNWFKNNKDWDKRDKEGHYTMTVWSIQEVKDNNYKYIGI